MLSPHLVDLLLGGLFPDVPFNTSMENKAILYTTECLYADGLSLPSWPLHSVGWRWALPSRKECRTTCLMTHAGKELQGEAGQELPQPVLTSEASGAAPPEGEFPRTCSPDLTHTTTAPPPG